MLLTSDLTLNPAKFDPAKISPKTSELNRTIKNCLEAVPNWWDVGIPEFRAMRMRGELQFPPAPVLLPETKVISIPSREAGRLLSCRMISPTTGTAVKGIVLHIHGGGWTLGSHEVNDWLLKYYASMGFVAISVGYRLAPEDPIPSCIEDCEDAGRYLVESGEKEFGGTLKFVTGESAGAHLSVMTAFFLLRNYPNFHLLGLLLHYGCYDLSGTPSALSPEEVPVLTRASTDRFIKECIPTAPRMQLKIPTVSPLYEDLGQWRGRLPKALVTVGTRDILLDDSVLLAAKWIIAGGEAILKVYPGALHGFVHFPTTFSDETAQLLADMKTYIQDLSAEA